jgi:hypothetical protein
MPTVQFSHLQMSDMKRLTRNSYIITATIFSQLVLFNAPVAAHHSIAVHYDMDNIQEVTGTLVSVNLRNPHTTLEFTVENEAGELDTWHGEAGALNAIRRDGISADSFQLGDPITVTGPVSRFGRKEMIAIAVDHKDQRHYLFAPIAKLMQMKVIDSSNSDKILSSGGNEVAPVEAPNIFRIWTPIDFPATAIHPLDLSLTESAKQAAQSYDEIADDLAIKCIAPGMPSMLDNPYPIEFVDQVDQIVMRYEEWGAERIVHMKEGSIQKDPTTKYGYSTGRWEDGSLLVETTNIDYPYFDDGGTPMTKGMTVTERYTLRTDQSRLDWTATFADSEVLLSPVSFGGSFGWVPDTQIMEFICKLEDDSSE